MMDLNLKPAPILLHGFRAIPRLDPRTFILEKKLTSSPTGVVFCARHLAHGTLVAVKTRLSPELGRSADVLHEVRMNIAHP